MKTQLFKYIGGGIKFIFFKFNITIVCMGLFTIQLHAQTATAPSIGTGTSSDSYQIATLDNLYWICANTANWNKHYIQTADINAAATSTNNYVGGFVVGVSKGYFFKLFVSVLFPFHIGQEMSPFYFSKLYYPMKKVFHPLALVMLFLGHALANNYALTNISVTGQDVTNDFSHSTFNLSWANRWRWNKSNRRNTCYGEKTGGAGSASALYSTMGAGGVFGTTADAENTSQFALAYLTHLPVQPQIRFFGL